MAIHIASPGMVATELLLGGDKDARATRFINILTEDAAVVAAWLVPRMRGVTGTGAYFKCAPLAQLHLLLLYFPASVNSWSVRMFQVHSAHLDCFESALVTHARPCCITWYALQASKRLEREVKAAPLACASANGDALHQTCPVSRPFQIMQSQK